MSEIDDISDALGSVFLQWRESAVGFVFSHHFSFDKTLNNFFVKKTPRMRNLFLFFLFVGVALSSLCSLFFLFFFWGFISAHTPTHAYINRRSF